MVNIKLLFIILEDGYDKKIKHLLNKYNISIKVTLNASGTASSSVLDYFGLSETKKEVFMAIAPDYLSSEILEKIKNDYKLSDIGKGIAFSVPIVSANKYLSESFEKEKNDGSENMANKIEIKYHLVMTIVSEGYLEQVMNAAKKAGAQGGTAIKGRGLAGEKKLKVLGFNIEPEKDIVLNLVKEESKTKVMEEITKEVGLKTPGRGICISLPVDEAVGLDAIN